MKNKIGVNRHKLLNIEKRIVNLKLNMLDENFTFNETELNFNYLIKLNNFLFNDFYFEENSGCRNLNDVERFIIEKKLCLIKRECISNPENIKKILDLICDIWHLQPFVMGNTRTMIGFLIALNNAFLLDIDIDLTKDIRSGPNMFKLNNVVNQNKLTKHK